MAKKPIEIEALKHSEARRVNIPTAELESVMQAADKSPVQLAYERRNRDLDPQLVALCACRWLEKQTVLNL